MDADIALAASSGLDIVVDGYHQRLTRWVEVLAAEDQIMTQAPEFGEVSLDCIGSSRLSAVVRVLRARLSPRLCSLSWS